MQLLGSVFVDDPKRYQTLWKSTLLAGRKGKVSDTVHEPKKIEDHGSRT